MTWSEYLAVDISNISYLSPSQSVVISQVWREITKSNDPRSPPSRWWMLWQSLWTVYFTDDCLEGRVLESVIQHSRRQHGNLWHLPSQISTKLGTNMSQGGTFTCQNFTTYFLVSVMLPTRQCNGILLLTSRSVPYCYILPTYVQASLL